MAPLLRRRGAALFPLSLILALLASGGCQGDRGDRPERGADRRPDAGPSMEASGTFFAGQLEVQVVLNRTGFGERPKPAPDAPSASSANPDLLPPAAEGTTSVPAPGDAVTGTGDTSGGRGHGGGGRHSGGSPSAGPRAGGDAAGPIRASTMAPVSFHLRLVNRSPLPVEAEVTDFNSDLGDFVVEPEKLSLQPGETADAEPMTSRLGVTSDAVALTVEIRLKAGTGLHKREKQVLTLRPAPAGEAPHPAAPPPLKFN